MYSLRADTTEPQPAIRAAKLQKVESNTKHIYLFLLPRRSNFDITRTQRVCPAVSFEGEDNKVDLMMYHTRLHCYVAIELKAKEFKPEYLSKLNY